MCAFPVLRAGRWNGWYQYHGNAYRFQVWLVVYPDGTVSGKGFDDDISEWNNGDFAIKGRWESQTSTVKLIKNYVGGHSLDYEGILAFNSMISGRWSHEKYSDTFLLAFDTG